jgi:glycosyltransferase involved in cell wall biosynthesis
MKRYRVPFFRELYQLLRRDGIELRVAYSPPNAIENCRNDTQDLTPDYGRKVRAFWIANRFLYQAVWREVHHADLVIVGNENKFLINPALLSLALARLKIVAFWGIGAEEENIRSSKLSSWIRDRTLNAVQWWFAYTEKGAAELRSLGVTCGITAVQNAVETSDLRQHIEDAEANRGELARTLGLGEGPIGIFCGALIPSKHLSFLLSAARLIRDRVPDFELLIVGDGPLREWLLGSIAGDSWIHYRGPKFGKDKALALITADLFLLPGNVGLAILDSFAAGLPLVTTDVPIHGPEVSYLRPGINGLMTPHKVEDYATAVVELLQNRDVLAQLSDQARQSAAHYTIGGMAQRYRDGVVQCLERHRSK